ncbi:MAG: hypothetical protein M0R30_03710 [Methanoregula sp.]|jgi:hypothetical protein|uniref:hypothetical protein n=1 Tax=Methanoregula sp. TaxID=2052170 RepID=UPI0025F7DE72|nr:hypothetical protein [Methanoregula sp.]MCK9630726.1 hypothetical protein [Methanoregula sp.]
MTVLTTVADCWLGLCRKRPVMQTTTAVMLGEAETAHPVQPDAGGAAGGLRRVRCGISIATGSIKTLFVERHLLWFSLLAGLVLLFLFVAEGWSVTHYDSFLPHYIWIPFGDSSIIVFNMQLFLIEAISLSGFTCLLAGLVLHRSAGRANGPVTIRKALAGVNIHNGTLAALSIAMAFVATVLFVQVSQSRFIGGFLHTIDMALFNLPYAYYVPNGITSMYYFSFRIMAINILLFLLALYVVPGIVLEGRRLLPALAGSVSLMKRTWRELLGCILVLGCIVLGVFAVGLLIGQSPLLLNHDYDFFLQMSRGQVLMTIACYGFLLGCCVLMALGSTVLGVAITELHTCGRTGSVHPLPKSDTTAVGEPSR